MYNKVIMIGNLTRDIELKYLPSGAAVGKSAIATSYKYKAQSGEQKEEVCFLDFNVFGKAAEILNQYTRKGSKVMLEGRLVLEQWTANDGSNRNRHTLRVDEFKFLDSKGDNPGGDNFGGGQPQQMGYNQNNGGYQQPQQNNYQQQQPAYNNQAQGGMQNGGYGGQAPQAQNIPEINIDEDEIPF
jgi:single-strand DNA-binding protein